MKDAGKTILHRHFVNVGGIASDIINLTRILVIRELHVTKYVSSAILKTSIGSKGLT